MASRCSIALAALLLGASPSAPRGDPAARPSGDDLTIVTLAVALSCSASPEAAPGAPEPALPRPPDAPPRAEIQATVRVRAIRFDELPEAAALVRLARRTSWRAERLNLPARPEPGVVYRDVEVRLTVFGEVEDLQALLAEARRASHGVRLAADDPPPDRE